MAAIEILTISSERDSAAKLGWTTHSYFPRDALNRIKKTVFVRWGNSEQIYKDEELLTLVSLPREINSVKSIRLNCTKPKALKQLSRIVCTPKVFLPEEDIPANVRVVLRPVEHSGGCGFRIVTGPYKISDYMYGTEFLFPTTEYRVWFAGNMTIRAKRVPVSKSQKEEEYPCRSNWGYSFEGGTTTPRSLHIATLKAAKCIGLEVGAADVLRYHNHYYFLELNSAPTIDHRFIRRFFQRGIERLVATKFKRCKS